jgi:hypothetical protein
MSSGQTGIFGPFPGEQDQTQALGVTGTAKAVAVGAAIRVPTPMARPSMPSGGRLLAGLQDLGGGESIAIAISADSRVIVGEARDISVILAGISLDRFYRHERYRYAWWPGECCVWSDKDGTVIVRTSLTSGSTGSKPLLSLDCRNRNSGS